MLNSPLFDENSSNIWLESEKHRTLAAKKISGRQKARPLDYLFTIGDVYENPENISVRTMSRLLHDPTISDSFNIIKNMVKSRGFNLSGGDDEIRDWAEDMLREVTYNDLVDNILFALIYGFSATELIYELVPNPIKGPAKIWKMVDSIYIRAQETKFVKGNEYVIQETGYGKQIKIPFGKCIVYTHNKEGGNMYGKSAIRAAYQSHEIKDFMIKFWSEHLELAGGAIRTMNVGSMPMDDGMVLLKAMKSGGSMVHGPDQDIKIHFPPAGQTQFRDFINFLDTAMAKAMGVPTSLMEQSGESGSRSLSETHFALVKLTLVTQLQQVVNYAVYLKVKELIRLNWGEQESYPIIRNKSWSTMDLEQLANVFSKLGKLGILGENDNAKLREEMEVWPIPPEGIGELLPIAGDKPLGLETDGIESPKRGNDPVT